MSEMYIKVRVPNYTPQAMSDDQLYQMVVLASEVQPYLPFKNVAIFDLIRISYHHCLSLITLFYLVFFEDSQDVFQKMQNNFRGHTKY